MRVQNPSSPVARIPFKNRLTSLAGGTTIAGALLLLLALRMEWISVLPASSSVAGHDAPAEESSPTSVKLSSEKVATAGLHTATVELKSIQPTRTVPGAINYDAARRLPVNSPVAGIIVDVLVEPGQNITAGRPLAVISSAEVGLARDEALKRAADLALAAKESAQAEQIATNVSDLVNRLRQRPKLDQLEKELGDRILGDYREKLLTSYSKLLLAESLVGGTDSLAEIGALSKRLTEERRSTREVAAAQFQSAGETSKFAAVQEWEKARAATEQAERLLSVAQKTLADLLGPNADMSPVTEKNKLSELVLLAPLAGRLEERLAVTSSRVAVGAPLFTVADTVMMWVEAEIHERDWQALDVATGASIGVRLPALNGAALNAKVRFIGSQVSDDKRSVPLIAEIDNSDGKLKPGMFAWVEVPLARPRETIVVPAGAVLRHDNRAFVFVPDGDNQFRRVDVEIGVVLRDVIEITSGLKPGDRVVDRGAFYLKSELLLEREE